MKATRTYQLNFAKTLVGYRLSSVKSGRILSTDFDILPPTVARLLDREIPRTEEGLFDAYENLFKKPGNTAVVSCGQVKGEVTSLLGYSLRVKITGPVDQISTLEPVPQGLMDAATHLSSGRWRWNRAHLTITGKDADLEPWGYQSAELVGVAGGMVHCVAHLGKTVSGNDVCLNLTPEQRQDENAYEKILDAYMEQAQEVVCGCGVGGEWSGDDWFLTEAVPFRVKLRTTPEETAAAIAKKLEQALKPAEREVVLLDNILDQISGWKDGKGNRCPEGQPSEGSISHYFATQGGAL